jgi:hypothetical protein
MRLSTLNSIMSLELALGVLFTSSKLILISTVPQDPRPPLLPNLPQEQILEIILFNWKSYIKYMMVTHLKPACSISTELSTDLYTTSERTLVMKKSVKGFQGGDEYVAILYEVEPKDLVIQRYPRIPNNQWPQNPYPQQYTCRETVTPMSLYYSTNIFLPYFATLTKPFAFRRCYIPTTPQALPVTTTKETPRLLRQTSSRRFFFKLDLLTFDACQVILYYLHL